MPSESRLTLAVRLAAGIVARLSNVREFVMEEVADDSLDLLAAIEAEMARREPSRREVHQPSLAAPSYRAGDPVREKPVVCVCGMPWTDEHAARVAGRKPGDPDEYGETCADYCQGCPSCGARHWPNVEPSAPASVQDDPPAPDLSLSPDAHRFCRTMRRDDGSVYCVDHRVTVLPAPNSPEIPDGSPDPAPDGDAELRARIASLTGQIAGHRDTIREQQTKIDQQARYIESTIRAQQDRIARDGQQIREQQERIATLTRERDEAREISVPAMQVAKSLRGCHSHTCQNNTRGGGKCICGMDDLRAALARQGEGE